VGRSLPFHASIWLLASGGSVSSYLKIISINLRQTIVLVPTAIILPQIRSP
jgi:hypothetical protein